MRKPHDLWAVICIAVAGTLIATPTRSAGAARPLVIFDGVATEVASSPATLRSTSGHLASLQATELWVTLADLRRATGFEVKPQGVCRKELCFPLPKDKRNDFLFKTPAAQSLGGPQTGRPGAGRGAVSWFNLSAFARMLHQAVAYDAPHRTWYIGPRPDVQNAYLSSLEAPNFTLPDMNGKQHSLSDFRGKKVLLITWASW